MHCEGRGSANRSASSAPPNHYHNETLRCFFGPSRPVTRSRALGWPFPSVGKCVGAERTAQRPSLSADEMHAGVWPVLDSTLAKHTAASLRKRSRSGLCLLDCSLFYQSVEGTKMLKLFLGLIAVTNHILSSRGEISSWRRPV